MKNTDNPPAVLIYLDLDGVIADFEPHAKACGKVLPNGKIDFDALEFTWWKTMPAAPGARAFYDEAANLAPTQFLTSPVLTPGCFGGKAEWITNFLPEKGKWSLRDLTITGDKASFARPNRILVDDREENIRAWVEAGGIGIHHKGDFEESLRELKQAVNNIRIKAPKKAPFAPKP